MTQSLPAVTFESMVEREFARRVRDNQARLRSAQLDQYDFVVCGAGRSALSVTKSSAG